MREVKAGKILHKKKMHNIAMPSFRHIYVVHPYTPITRKQMEM